MVKAQIIYVVTQGEYSDYSIKGLFSTKELAQAWIDEDKGNSVYGAGIEEWSLDAMAGWKMRKGYLVSINLETGEIVRMWEDEQMAPPLTRSISARQRLNPPRMMTSSFVSWEHAEKLAVEARQKWMRDQANLPAN